MEPVGSLLREADSSVALKPLLTLDHEHTFFAETYHTMPRARSKRPRVPPKSKATRSTQSRCSPTTSQVILVVSSDDDEAGPSTVRSRAPVGRSTSSDDEIWTTARSPSVEILTDNGSHAKQKGPASPRKSTSTLVRQLREANKVCPDLLVSLYIVCSQCIQFYRK